MNKTSFSHSFCLLAALASGVIPSIALARGPVPSATQLGAKFTDYLSNCQAAAVCNGVFLVARHGKPIFIGAVGDAGDPARPALTANSQFDIGSISKQFTAVAILRLVRSGTLQISDRVSTHLPAFPYSDVTISQLLSHTAGLPDAMAYYSGLLRSGKATQPLTGGDVVEVLARHQRPLLFTPGTRYEYSNTGYLVLAALVEAKTGVPFARHLEHTLFRPLGLSHTLLRTPENESQITRRAFGFRPLPSGERKPFDQLPGFYVQGAGGIYSTASDLLKWENALSNGTMLTKAEWHQATTPAKLNDGTSVPYGLGLSLRLEPGQTARLGHGGNYRGFLSHMAYFPNADVTIIMLTNNTAERRLETLSKGLLAIALGQLPEAVRPSISADLFRRVNSEPAASTRGWFAQEAGASPRRYEIVETELNALGYSFLQAGEKEKARLVFELIVKAFPKSANAHDSLSEALEALGDYPAALAEARAALALDPQSQTLQQKVEVLSSKTR